MFRDGISSIPDETVIPRVMKDCSPTGRRNHGRPLKRLLGM
jgi:hypothetical protein